MFSYRNKVRLCCVIFIALIFLDIVAFFDTLGPIFSFDQIQNGSSVPLWPDLKEPCPGVERGNISENLTKTLESEEVVFGGEIIHSVALLLVELLGLFVLLVPDSHRPQREWI